MDEDDPKNHSVCFPGKYRSNEAAGWEIQMQNTAEKYSSKFGGERKSVWTLSRKSVSNEAAIWEMQIRNTAEKFCWKIRLRNMIEKNSWEENQCGYFPEKYQSSETSHWLLLWRPIMGNIIKSQMDVALWCYKYVWLDEWDWVGWCLGGVGNRAPYGATKCDIDTIHINISMWFRHKHKCIKQRCEVKHRNLTFAILLLMCFMQWTGYWRCW